MKRFLPPWSQGRVSMSKSEMTTSPACCYHVKSERKRKLFINGIDWPTISVVGRMWPARAADGQPHKWRGGPHLAHSWSHRDDNWFWMNWTDFSLLRRRLPLRRSSSRWSMTAWSNFHVALLRHRLRLALPVPRQQLPLSRRPLLIFLQHPKIENWIHSHK